MSILDDIPFVRRTRRNHAIEHAAVHILSARWPGLAMAGRSDSRGFWLYGDVDSAQVDSAVREAMDRLDAEPHLAIHPHCGTNLVVGGMMAGLTTLVAVNHLRQGRRQESAFETLPRLMLAGTVAGVASQPLGPLAQKHVTTLPRASDARLVSVERSERGKHVVHRITIEDKEDDGGDRADPNGFDGPADMADMADMDREMADAVAGAPPGFGKPPAASDPWAGVPDAEL